MVCFGASVNVLWEQVLSNEDIQFRFMISRYTSTRRPGVEWTFRRGAWTFDRCSFGRRALQLTPKPTIMDKSSERGSFSTALAAPWKSLRAVALPVFCRRMVVHPAERPRKVKLVAEAELIADLLDRQVRAVEQLHGVLHPQMVQV